MTVSSRYYYWREGDPVIGPVSQEELERLWREGVADHPVRVAREGAHVWESRDSFAPVRLPSSSMVPPPIPFPPGLTVIALIHTLLGLTRLAFLPFRLVPVAVAMLLAKAGLEGIEGPVGWRLFDLFLDGFTSLWLLMGGVGLFQRRSAGLSLAVSASILMIGRVLLAFVGKTVFYAVSGQPPLAPIQVPFSLMVGLLYPLIALVVLNRPAVRRLFLP